ncbi:hypothetical protein Nepgr_019917 [Nepenthes gracilis]|uniref:C3H1-type domain-containing protein n=1 Tax=Nepenthes gracilis TaxID=150966 RepID=A0AAD3XVU4_NEPGR|nr:hypothetical protein Nepgr_019917 [Nepenthes gracilis]
MAPPRILLCGDVLGRLCQLFKRVLSVNKSAGPFDALLCVGQFFPDSDDRLDEFMEYMEGKSEIPIPTYFIGDYGVGTAKVLFDATNDPQNQGFRMDGLKICNNLYWLKGSGKFVLHGLSVAYLSGRKSSSGQRFGMYSQDDVDALRAFAEEPGIVDLFLTYPFYVLAPASLNPLGVTNRAAPDDVPPNISLESGSDSTAAELVSDIKPRYHIAGSKGMFYSREPYSNVSAAHVTRFFGLAPVGNKDRQKFMHAISPTPASTMSATEISIKPPNTTMSPYEAIDKLTPTKEATKRPIDSSPEAQYWRYDVKKQRQGDGDGDGDKLCFKFLSSGSCARGEKCHFQHNADAREQYLRGVCLDFLVKGKCERGPECQFIHKLLEEGENVSGQRRNFDSASRSKECWFCLSSPNVESHLIVSIGEHIYCALAKGPLVDDHLLIIPIEHSPSTLSLPPECEKELCQFQSILRTHFKSHRKEIIFFELISKRGTHANLQVVPVPSTKASSVKTIFSLAAKKLGFEFETMNVDTNSEGRKRAKIHFESRSGFFYVELPDGTILSHAIEENENFPVQFGREVLAGLLKKPEKADWRNWVRCFVVIAREHSADEQRIDSLRLSAMVQSAKPISSPVPESLYPTLAVLMLAIGLAVAASFFIYEATISRKNRSLAKELITGAVASIFLGFGSLFLLLSAGVYV